MKLHAALLNNAEDALHTLDQARAKTVGPTYTYLYYSDFHNQVFDNVFGAFIAALDDTMAVRPRAYIHVSSAPVGCGKTTCAVACIAGLINSTEEFREIAGHAPTALFVVEQIQRAEEIYRDLCSLIGEDKVAVWSHDHDTKTDPAQRIG